MKIRKVILITIIFLWSLLFINGISILALKNTNNGDENDTNNMTYPEAKDSEWYASGNDIINVLLLGLDSEETRTDVIMFLNYSSGGKKLNILSIPRDTRVRVRGRIEKINAVAVIGGEELIIKGVEQITGLPIRYYLSLNFEGFREIIDVLGGVVMDVPINMKYNDPEQNLRIDLRKGIQVLDGQRAEQFVRYRKGNNPGEGYIDGDVGRNRMQQVFVKELITQKLKLKYLTKADDIFFILQDYMKTNIEITDIRHFAALYKGVDNLEINNYQLPGDSVCINNLWYFICDIEKTKELIDDNFFD